MTIHPLLRPIVHAKPPRRRRKKSPVIDYTDQFFRFIDPALAPGSQRVVRRAMWSLRRGLAGKEPTSENVLTWLRRRVAVDRIAPATLSVERIYANKFFEWCISMGYMDKNPLTPIPRVPVPLTNKPIITEEQFAALLKAAEGTIMWPLLKVAWYTGARLVDICNLHWSSLDLDNRIIKFTPQKTVKSGRQVELRIPQELVDLFTAQETTEFVFPDALEMHMRDNGSLQRLFRYIANKAGLPKAVTFHCLRHTRASRMLNGEHKVDPLVAADVLGLSSLATLRRYTKISLDEKERATNL